MSYPRIIFLNRVYWPSTAATAQLLTDLAEGLAARGWPVHVIAGGDGPSECNGVTIHRTGADPSSSGLLTRAMEHRRFVRAARQQLVPLVRSGDIVVPMTDPPLLGAMLSRDAAAQGAHVVHWVQDIYPEIAAVHFGTLTGIALAPLRFKRDSAWRTASACVVLGTGMKQSVASRGVQTDRIAVLPNWAPRELHSPVSPDAIEHQRRQWNLAGKFVVSYSGNLGRVHEFETILQAAGRLRDNPAIAFLFIGAGARFEEVRSAARDRGLDNIRLLPPEPRENLGPSLRAADAQLVTLRTPYANLVYPSKLAGSLAAGRPVLFVGPTDGEIAGLIRQENCGAVLAEGDGAGLAGQILHWSQDADLRARLGANSRTSYERLFTYEASLARWDELLRRLGGTQRQDRFALPKSAPEYPPR